MITALAVISILYIKNNKSIEKKKISDGIYYQSVDTDDIVYEKNIGKIIWNELILETSGETEDTIRELLDKEGGKIVGCIDITNTYQIEFPGIHNIEELKEKKHSLEQNDKIDLVSFNYVLPFVNFSEFYPNDAVWKEQWDDSMVSGNWGMKAIHAPEAWGYIKDNIHDPEEVDIGIFEVDDLNAEHEDLKNNLKNIQGKSSDVNKTAHGTAVAGIIGADFDNDMGISGVMMDNVKLNYFSFNSKNSEEESLMAYQSGLSSLVKENGKNSPAIINVSLGLEQYQIVGTFGAQEELLQELNSTNEIITNDLKKLLNEGYDFLIVKAAGNLSNHQYLKVDLKDFENEEDDEWITKGFVPYSSDKKSETYKKYSKIYKKYKKELKQRLCCGDVDAQYDIFSGITDKEIKDRIIVVGGSENPKDGDYPLYYFTSKGDRVDITAPGVNIQSTRGNNEYVNGLAGTSFSAPYVSGVAGLILTAKSDMTGTELKSALIQSGSGSYNFGTNGKRNNVPMVNAKQALTRVSKYDRNHITVQYDYRTEDANEYAVITGVNDLNQTVWEYTTKKYSIGVVPIVSEIGQLDDIYCFAEGGIIKALYLSDGSVAWENTEYNGAVTDCIIQNSIIYLSGYYGPDFFAIDKSGKTLCEIKTMDEQFYWPYKMEYKDGKIRLIFEETSIEGASNVYALLDPKDYSYKFFYDLPEPEIAKPDLEGYQLYYDPDTPDNTLEIYSVDNEKIVFTAFWYRIGDLYNVTAKWNGKEGTFNYINPDTGKGAKGVLSFSGEEIVLKLTESSTPYVDPGTYTYKLGAKKISETVIENTRQWLRAPSEAEADVGIPVYWEAGGYFTTRIDFIIDGKAVAGADVHSLTGEVIKEIVTYSG